MTLSQAHCHRFMNIMMPRIYQCSLLQPSAQLWQGRSNSNHSVKCIGGNVRILHCMLVKHRVESCFKVEHDQTNAEQVTFHCERETSNMPNDMPSCKKVFISHLIPLNISCAIFQLFSFTQSPLLVRLIAKTYSTINSLQCITLRLFCRKDQPCC